LLSRARNNNLIGANKHRGKSTMHGL